MTRGIRPPARRSQPWLYDDALVNLRVRQLAYRPRRLLPIGLLAAGTRERAPTAWAPLAGGLGVDGAPQSGPVAAAQRTGCFRAVGGRGHFLDEGSFWQPGDDGLLFAFHLHGFSELARHAQSVACAADDAFWGSLAMDVGEVRGVVAV
jgi:hypothetical protein